MLLGKIFPSLLKVLKQLLTHSGNSEKETFVLNDPGSTPSKTMLEIKPMLTTQPVLNSALLRYASVRFLALLIFAKTDVGCAVEQGASVLPTAPGTAALQLHSLLPQEERKQPNAAFENGIASLSFTGKMLGYLQ